LRNSCPDLEIIDLSGNIITSQGIHALAECKNLRKLTMIEINIFAPAGYCIIDKHSLHRLFSSCQRLEEVNLMDFYSVGCPDDFYVHDDDLTLCKNLRQLYLGGGISSFAILEQCPKLQTIYVLRYWSNDTHDRQAFVAQAKEKYPHVSILKYQKEFDHDDEGYEDDVGRWHSYQFG
ncbi:F-box/LRR-repeat protein 4, partial [Temnothorax longispinosus]